MQKEEEKQWKEELENIAAEPFARTVDDTRLEEARKAEIRADDPMAAYMAKVPTPSGYFVCCLQFVLVAAVFFSGVAWCRGILGVAASTVVSRGNRRVCRCSFCLVPALGDVAWAAFGAVVVLGVVAAAAISLLLVYCGQEVVSSCHHCAPHVVRSGVCSSHSPGIYPAQNFVPAASVGFRLFRRFCRALSVAKKMLPEGPISPRP